MIPGLSMINNLICIVTTRVVAYYRHICRQRLAAPCIPICADRLGATCSMCIRNVGIGGGGVYCKFMKHQSRYITPIAYKVDPLYTTYGLTYPC